MTFQIYVFSSTCPQIQPREMFAGMWSIWLRYFAQLPDLPEAGQRQCGHWTTITIDLDNQTIMSENHTCH